MKAVDVRRKNDENRYNRAERLHAFDHVTTADLLNELGEKAKRQLLSYHVCHQKRATLGLRYGADFIVQLRFYVRPGEVTGEFFPK